jgi:hypothetical protein
MKLLLQVVAIIAVTFAASLALSVWTAPALPSSEELHKETVGSFGLAGILLDHPPSALRACGLLDRTGAIVSATHAELVEAARCLRRKHLITARDVAKIKKAKDLIIGRRDTLPVTISWSWLPLAAGLALSLLLVYRRWQRRPPGF